MRFNLEDSNSLRIDFCNIQKTQAEVKDCTNEYKSYLKAHDMDGFHVALLLIGVFFIGVIVGGFSSRC